MAASANDVTKKPNTKSAYTEEQLLDLAKCSTDPIFFMKNFVKVQHPKRGLLPFEPWEYQERLVRAFHENRFVIGMTGRQMGKSIHYRNSVLRDELQVKIGSLIPLYFREKLVSWLENILVAIA